MSPMRNRFIVNLSHADPPSEWTVVQVGHWLKALSLGQYLGVFSTNNMDGEALRETSRDDFKELIPALGDRTKILKARDTLFGINP